MPRATRANGEEAICSHCGAKMVEYRFTFSRGYARALWKLGRSSGYVEISRIDFNKYEYSNFQKMRHWGLIRRPRQEDERGGLWGVTRRGRLFLRGELQIQESVITYRGERVRFEGPLISFEDVTGGYDYRGHYRRQAARQIRGELL